MVVSNSSIVQILTTRLRDSLVQDLCIASSVWILSALIKDLMLAFKVRKCRAIFKPVPEHIFVEY